MTPRQSHSRQRPDPPHHDGLAAGAFLSPIGDDPESWSMSVGRVRGLTIRLHALLVLYAASEMFRAVFHIGGEATSSAGIVATSLTGLAIAALIHEVGRALITRWAGGEADSLVLWPLGGMATHRLPSSTQHRLLASIGGLIASISLACILWPILFNVTSNWYFVLVDPIHPSPVYAEWVLVRGGAPSWWMSLIWWTGYGNIVVMYANLIPAYPLDGATVIEVVASRLLGRRRAMSWSITLALAICLSLLLAGLMTHQVLVVFLAGFGWVCGTRRARQASFMDGVDDLSVWDQPHMSAHDADDQALFDVADDQGESGEQNVIRAPRSLSSFETDTFEVTGGALGQAGQSPTSTEEAEMDRILAKIGEAGMASLTDAEKRTLKIMTARRRRRG